MNDDTVSRRAAIDVLERKLAEPYHTDEDWYVGINCAEAEIYGLPSAQPEINYSETPNTSDVVSRKAVREMVATWSYDLMENEDLNMALHDVDELPPAQDFHIDFADLRAEQEERNIATPILNPNGNME